MPGRRTAKPASSASSAAEEKRQRKREIGRRLKEARLEAGRMEQRELADLLGVTVRSVQAYEQGETIPYRYIEKIGEVLDVSPYWLLHGQEEPREVELEMVLKEIRSLGKRIERLEKSLG